MKSINRLFGKIPAVCLPVFFTLLTVRAQEEVLSKEAYLMPPKIIADAVLASRSDRMALTNLSPDGKVFLIKKTGGLPGLDLLAHPYVHLSEMTFDPVARRARDLWLRSDIGYDLFYYAENRTVPVQIPPHARVSNPIWSPDGSQLAFFALLDEATQIYIADTKTGASAKLTPAPILAALDTTFRWSKDGKHIEAVLVPEDKTDSHPKPDAVAAEPRVRLVRGGLNPSRTYRYLLESPYDMKLLEDLVTGQLALIDVKNGQITKVGAPAMIRSVSMAHSEQDFRVGLLEKPFSYFVPMSRFGNEELVWNEEGKSLLTLSERKLQETEPPPGAQTNQTLLAGQDTGRRGGGGRRGGRGGRGATPDQTATTDPAQPQVAATVPDPTPVDPADPYADPSDAPRGPRASADPNGKRDIIWRPDGAGLSYLQLEPVGKETNAPRKDQVLEWLPPFGSNDVKVLYATTNRLASLQYSPDGQILFLSETVNNQRQICAVDLKDPQTSTVLYKGPGGGAGGRGGRGGGAAGRGGGAGGRGGGAGGVASLLTRPGEDAAVVRVSSTGNVYLTGTDRAGTNGNGSAKPYIDQVSLKTGEKKRIFESKPDIVETIETVDGDDIKCVFTSRQSVDQPPNYFCHDLASGKETQLTDNTNQTPWFNQFKVENFTVTRVDGFKFHVKVTTPPNRSGKLPAMFWIYPREYTNQAAYTAGTRRGGGAGPGSTNRYSGPGPRSITLLCLLDYAVVEPDIPIVGPAGRMNDNYVPDLVNSLWAVIDDLDKRGIIDRDRLAVGGHSYGAFSTANALAHTPFFKAGIAGDGNYNRTLTAMTFQSERRDLWTARETYLDMSPILWANQVNGALLMYHSMDDANVGTDPINAEHMFLALDGLGKPAALYMYPYEDHGPLAKETDLDQWARWIAWLDKYVKNPAKKTSQPEPVPADGQEESGR